MTKSDCEKMVDQAVGKTRGKKGKLAAQDTFLGTLGFDSVRMVTLSLNLEEAFGRPLLLNDWLASSADPSELSVGSLQQYVWSVISAS